MDRAVVPDSCRDEASLRVGTQPAGGAIRSRRIYVLKEINSRTSSPRLQRSTSFAPEITRNPGVRQRESHAAIRTRRADSTGNDGTTQPATRRYDDAA